MRKVYHWGTRKLLKLAPLSETSIMKESDDVGANCTMKVFLFKDNVDNHTFNFKHWRYTVSSVVSMQSQKVLTEGYRRKFSA
ncbi:hypothetical protein J6590_049903, partial [Homalodisca vitripennis]